MQDDVHQHMMTHMANAVSMQTSSADKLVYTRSLCTSVLSDAIYSCAACSIVQHGSTVKRNEWCFFYSAEHKMHGVGGGRYHNNNNNNNTK